MGDVRLTNKLRKFGNLEGKDKWMFLHAALWLAAARMMLLVMPFRKLAARLSSKGEAEVGVADEELLRRIGTAVGAAAGNVPWRSDCFPQAIAGHMLLRHHGYRSTIHLGVERGSGDGLKGHAWLTSGDAVVTGGEDLHRYVETLRIDG
jgi:hypothetical protein